MVSSIIFDKCVFSDLISMIFIDHLALKNIYFKFKSNEPVFGGNKIVNNWHMYIHFLIFFYQINLNAYFSCRKTKKIKRECRRDHFKSNLFTYIEYVLVALKRHSRANIFIYFKVKLKITTIAGNKHSTPTRDNSKMKIINKMTN